MPRALSAPVIHISQVTALCENNVELPAFSPSKLDDVDITIGNLIADEIPNGATIQLGIGSIPDAVGMALKSKHDLGIHTEMFTDSMVELLECGAANNLRKPIHRGRSVTTFALGSKRMYDYIDNNPAIEILPVDYVNNPSTIALHPNFISINGALEVDFFGQVCAESVGTYHISVLADRWIMFEEQFNPREAKLSHSRLLPRMVQSAGLSPYCHPVQLLPLAKTMWIILLRSTVSLSCAAAHMIICTGIDCYCTPEISG